jgi:transposase
MQGRIIVVLRRHQRRRLKKWLRRTRDAQLSRRIQVVLLYGRGLGCDQVSRALGVSAPTAARVARRFVEEGEAGLVDRRKQNGCPKVDADTLEAVHRLVSASPRNFGFARATWTRELLAKALFRIARVRVGSTTISRMLSQLGARWGTPRPRVACPWPRRRRQARIRAIRRLVAGATTDEPVFFEDEVDIHLNPKIGPDWMLPRQQKFVMTPGQNQKRYVAGALNSGTGDLVFVQSTHKNSDLFITLLAKLMRSYSSAKRIHLVLDNYGIHSSKRVREFLVDYAPKIELHFLPPYCPEANRIERVWLDLHASVTRNHASPTIQHLMARVRRYLATHEKRKRRAARLLARRAGNITRRAA